MSTTLASPLSALAAFYDRSERDPNSAVPLFGFSRKKVHFQVVIDPKGALVALEDIREANTRGKPVPRIEEVPDGGGRSSTTIRPFFCWDDTGYALGRDTKGNAKRAETKFAAFRDLHLTLRDELPQDPGFLALCRFLEGWDPQKAEQVNEWKEAAGLNVVFRLRGQEGFVHQSERVREAWLRRVSKLSNDDEAIDQSLVSGKREPIARLHPLIRGVANANTTGAAIVSFNLDAFSSYGRRQSYNAPVGVRDAFRYTTALNGLLADASRRVRMGDATVVFWADRANAQRAEEVFAAFFGGAVSKGDAAESGSTLDRVRSFLIAAKQGHLVDALGDPQALFYILGLSPNASRINLRLWLVGSVGEFGRQLAQSQAELTIAAGLEDVLPLTISAILDETVQSKRGRPDRGRVLPALGGQLARALLLGLPYPAALFSTVIERIRAEGFATRNRKARGYRKDIDWRMVAHHRAAILKAWLIRNKHWEVPVALNKDHPDEAYHLGRLFAALEKTQEDGSERELNSTIKDRYFAAASATPANVFPVLLRLHQHHLDKLDNVGLRVNREKLVTEICSHLTGLPRQLPLEKQGLFHIAYYHQRQDFFRAKGEAAKEAANA